MCYIEVNEDKLFLMDVHLESEQGNFYRGIQGNHLARPVSWRWEGQCLHSG